LFSFANSVVHDDATPIVPQLRLERQHAVLWR